ncbi:lipoyl synthase [Candidatus Woesearchaeota archaeon]|nr:lipoyl synthase [Candidatus Woesearchaeota archaeon]
MQGRNSDGSIRPIPSDAKKRIDRHQYLATLSLLTENKLTTVCMEANCPNRYECFSAKTATFMIMGDTCTRNCLYCNVKHGKPQILDENEPRRIADAIKELGLKYVVITCVTRDDLGDGGASHFVKVIEEVKKQGCKVEVLISDLRGNIAALKTIIDAKPDVLNHNIEVTRDIFPKVRPSGDYDLSLMLLKEVKRTDPIMLTKSGLMVGLGESKEDIIKTLKDLRKVDVDIVTIGQYMQPSDDHADVVKEYSDEEFEELKDIALDLGFKNAASGRLVRSSYRARELHGE